MLHVSTKRLALLCLLGAFLSGLVTSTTFAQAALNGLETIENGIIKVGVDSRYGGAISYLAPVGGQNMVNNFDPGRQFQISTYSGPANYSQFGNPIWSGIGWNAIQGGDWTGNPSRVIAFHKQANELYVKTLGKQFALNNVDGEVYIEHWVRLSGNVVKVHAKVTLFRTDKTQYEARSQEFPCLFINPAYNNIYLYQGNNPYSNGSLTRIAAPTEQEYMRPATEPWMAATNNAGFGVGLYKPYNYHWTKGYFGDVRDTGEFGYSSTYVAAGDQVILDHNIVHEWDYDLIVGNINEIRNYVYTQPRLASTINYKFDNGTRKGWFYYKATDAGWPIQGYLNVQVTNKAEATIKSPVGFWRGRDNKTIYLRAAFQGQSDTYRFYWRQLNDRDFLPTEGRFIDFPIINDGQFHTYAIDLSQKSGWVDQDICQIAFCPRWTGPEVNGWVKIESVTTSPSSDPVVTTPTAPQPTTPVPTAPSTPTPTTPPTGGSTLQLAAPTYNCSTGALTFNTTGGNGSPIEYMAIGLTGWTTNPNQVVPAGLRADATAQPLTLMARQGGTLVTYTFNFKAACTGTPTTPPTTTPPVTSTPIPSAPSTGGSLQLVAPTYNCSTGALTFNTTGGNGSRIEYMAIGITGWTTNPNHVISAGLRSDPTVQPLTLQARQNGTTVTYTFNFRAACTGAPGTTTPAPTSPSTGGSLQLVAPTYNCSTGALTFNTTGGNGSRIEYMAIGVTGWTTNPNQAIEAGVRSDASTQTITLQARQSGVTVSYTYNFRAACSGAAASLSPTSPGGPVGGLSPGPGDTSVQGQPLQLLLPGYNCQTGAVTFRTSGGNGSTIEYLGIGITDWTTDPNQYVDAGLRQDPTIKPLTLQARQSGLTVSYSFDLRGYCNTASGARTVASDDESLKVTTWGNPVVDQLVVVVEGYVGETLNFKITNYNGRVLQTRTLHNGDRAGQHVFNLGGEDAGILLVQVSDGTQMNTVKVMKQ